MIPLFIIAGLGICLFVYGYRRRRRRLYLAACEAILPQLGLQVTLGKQTPDAELKDYQVATKRAANRFGFKVKLIPGWDEDTIPGMKEWKQKQELLDPHDANGQK